MNHSHIGRARLLSSRGGPYYLRIASYTRPDPGAPRVGCFQTEGFLPIQANWRGSARATAVEIDIGTCRSASLRTQVLPKEGHPTETRSTITVQVLIACREHHYSRFKGIFAARLGPGAGAEGLSDGIES